MNPHTIVLPTMFGYELGYLGLGTIIALGFIAKGIYDGYKDRSPKG